MRKSYIWETSILLRIPFREGGFGVFLGGSGFIVVGEILEKFGAQVVPPYGSLPGLLIKIGAICMCISYSIKVVRSAYLSEKSLPFWEASTISFSQFIMDIMPVLVSIAYGFLLSLIIFLISIYSNNKNDFITFLTNPWNYGLFIFCSILYPAICFLYSIEPEDVAHIINPITIGKAIVNAFPLYIFLIIAALLVINILVYLKILFLSFLGSFIVWFIKFYFLVLLSLIIGKVYAKTSPPENI